MTICNRIKSELFNADINYYAALDDYRKDYPYGTNFCGETVSSKAASAANRLQVAEAKVTVLSYLVTCKMDIKTIEAESRRLIDKYNNAETSEEAEQAEQEYYSLYTVRND